MAKKYNRRYCFGMKSEMCGYPFRVSRSFKMTTFKGAVATTTRIVGSANDIMKVIRDLKWAGYTPYDYEGMQNVSTFRANKKYVIEFDDIYADYCVRQYRGKF